MKDLMIFACFLILFFSVANCNYKKDEIENLEEEKLRLEIKNLKLDLEMDSIKKQNLKQS